MLDNVPSCNLVQYQGNIMMQPWKNGKNPYLKPDWASPHPPPLPKIFKGVFPLLVIRQCSKLSFYSISRKSNKPKYLDIVPSYVPMQFKGKLMNQTWENNKRKLILDPILACLATWATQFFLASFTSTSS